MKKKMIPTKDLPTKPVTIRMPVDVVDDLKRVAPEKGMSGYQALIKFYVGQGLREDLELLWKKERAEKLDATLTEFGLKPEQKDRILDLLRDHPRLKTAER
jgi:hypothetical protein